MTRPTKLWVVVVAIILGWIFADVVYPTPNVAGGGGVHMVVFIVLTVIFKATIEYVISRLKKKKQQ